ncbi:adenosylcobinamide-GDP ribazoletransferase [Tardiphaga sp. 709]|jgi:adenosylcobinamide-GDP ribazoletransferase|uniref:adenosylcobinamide-GDP ribazoletransferase n=1 Tax=unclassified Tardiphaga TaxID=2631404 RepID=UPI0028E56C76|nr:adenosylcobinamide-GDP ribazoletransferase [Tardiphaga sp. 709]WNV11241.1 adenosylcobinamide-GDP ribazoletransferase [Tardiphaga sp. 709]
MRLDPHLLNAIRFLTVLPVPATGDAQEADWLARAMKYFPIVGAGIGAASAIVFLVASEFWSPLIAALLAITTSIVITSALHEDGLADTADSFGGGWTIEKRLAIMKDSRIGTYGALALGLGTALRIAALAILPMWAGATALIAVHAAARAMPALVMNRLPYGGDTSAMKVTYAEAPVRFEESLFALVVIVLAAIPLALVSLASLAAGLLLGAALAALLALWSRRLIGGYTGDVLGAVEQLFEIGFLLGVAALIK